MTSTRTSEQPGPTRSRPGGRSARVRAGVLAAARELVAEQGYEPVSIEQIAARAGVHKTTVYRRWPTKARPTRPEAPETRARMQICLHVQAKPGNFAREGDGDLSARRFALSPRSRSSFVKI